RCCRSSRTMLARSWRTQKSWRARCGTAASAWCPAAPTRTSSWSIRGPTVRPANRREEPGARASHLQQEWHSLRPGDASGHIGCPAWYTGGNLARICVAEFALIGGLIADVLDGLAEHPDGNAPIEARARRPVLELCRRFPIYDTTSAG